ncbi:hypothetical protein [Leeuwenhoekiella parthenopeia]|uniref:Uncharacterized protein n=1 Tax=Leeuwenhoekiella parthenopeia TaxID=2890320 RepID=A0ABS8GWE4_9FLAO|nr:hypothetical protein [Leeuwenhoekiella parthenopeia]MCC4213793.1 hypothetical protein [Leeuwenhoekiella parthenopeia]
MTRKLLFQLGVIIFGSGLMTAQVGIGTSNPQHQLDVAGNVRVRDLSSTGLDLTGTTTNGLLRKTELGGGIIKENNKKEIRLTPTKLSLGEYDLDTVIPDNDSGGNRFYNNLDLDILGTNKDITLLTVFNTGGKVSITGLKDGSHGRRVIIYNAGTANMSFEQDSPESLPQNRILTLANASRSTSGQGFCELVYDENGGDDALGRWFIIKFQE